MDAGDSCLNVAILPSPGIGHITQLDPVAPEMSEGTTPARHPAPGLQAMDTGNPSRHVAVPLISPGIGHIAQPGPVSPGVLEVTTQARHPAPGLQAMDTGNPVAPEMSEATTPARHPAPGLQAMDTGNPSRHVAVPLSPGIGHIGQPGPVSPGVLEVTTQARHPAPGLAAMDVTMLAEGTTSASHPASGPAAMNVNEPAPHVAILPSPGIGHVTPFLELGRRLVSQHGLRVTVFILTADSSFAQDQILRSVSLPDGLRLVELPPADNDAVASIPQDAFFETRISLLIRASLPSLRSALQESSPPVSVLVVDIFGTDAFDVAGDLHLPRYMFFTTTAETLAIMLHSPALDLEVAPDEFADLPGPVLVPGCTPIRPADLLDPMLDQKNERYRWYLHHASRFPLAHGILVNTVEEIEPGPITAMREDPAMVELPTPPLYPVGPVIKSGGSHRKSEHECLEWLDLQPPGSVLFVSFGSGGTLSAEQTAELAWGLELSQQRFLWVVRRPTDGAPSSAFFTCGGDPDDPASYLPDGFAKKTEGRGFLVPSWAPQLEVLGHPAVGGFLTHGGWNSALESVAHGVAMVVWPLYAEQRTNAAMMEGVLKVAVRVRPEGGLVKREEVERVARLLMEGDEGKAVKGKVAELCDCFTKALAEGGSSHTSLAQVVAQWRRKDVAHHPAEKEIHTCAVLCML